MGWLVNQFGGTYVLVGRRGGHHVVIADGDERAVVKQRDEHEHQDGHVEESRPRLRGACL